MSFARDTLKSAGAGLVLTISRFFTMAIIARQLGVEDFGILGFGIFCLDLIALFALAGLPGLTSRYLPLASMDERSVIWRMVILWLVVSIGLVIVAAPIVAIAVIGLSGMALYVFCAWALVVVLQTASVAQMQGSLRFDLLAWGNGAGAIVMLAGAALFVEPGGLVAAFVVLACSVFLQFLPVVLIWTGVAKPAPPRSETAGLPARRDIVMYGLNAWVATITTAIVWGRGEVLVIESMLSAEALGFYGAAMTLMAMVWRMTQMLQGAVAPHLSGRIKTGGEDLHRFVMGINRLTLAISAGSALALALCGREIAVLVFGQAFSRSGEILAYLAPGTAVAGIGTVNLAVQYLSEGRFTRNAVLIATFVLLGLSVLLIGAFDVFGAATARAAILICMSISMPLWMITSGYATLGKKVSTELLAIVLVVACASLLSLFADLPFWLRASLWFVTTYVIFGRATGSFVPQRMIRGGVRILRAL